eukprot:2346364-Rhodomonas_salina.5
MITCACECARVQSASARAHVWHVPEDVKSVCVLGSALPTKFSTMVCFADKQYCGPLFLPAVLRSALRTRSSSAEVCWYSSLSPPTALRTQA